MSIESQIKEAAERAVLKFVLDGGWLMPNYESRIKVPAEIYAEAWAMVDRDKLRARLAERLENELADRLVNAIATELATDVKQILSVKERREAVRELARKHMVSIMAAGADPQP